MRRSRDSGSVFRRRYRGADGKVRLTRTWTIAWKDKQGRHREATEATSKAEAEVLLRTKLAARDAGEQTAPVLTTVSQLVAMVEADYKANGRRSLKRVQQAGARVLGYFGKDERATAVTNDRVVAFAAYRLDEKAKPATVNRELAVLRRGFNLAKDAQKVDAVPRIRMLAEHNTRKGFVDRAQLDAILAHLPAEAKAPVLVAYLTGWRMFSEVLTREWRHVDLDAGWLRLEPGEGKTGEGRMYPLAGELLDILKALDKEAKASGRIVARVFHRNGQPIAGFRKAWLSACKKAGLPGRLIHDLRRSAVRNMERAGVPRSAAMALVGHKTDSVYRRYAVVGESMLREAAAKLTAASLRVDGSSARSVGARRKRRSR